MKVLEFNISNFKALKVTSVLESPEKKVLEFAWDAVRNFCQS